jgi:hypothetical protein
VNLRKDSCNKNLTWKPIVIKQTIGQNSPGDILRIARVETVFSGLLFAIVYDYSLPKK